VNTFRALAVLYSALNAEQLWMLHVGATVVGVGLLLGFAWTSWDVLRPLAGPHVEYVWWWLRDLLGFVEEPQPPSLAGVTIVKPRRAPDARRSLHEHAQRGGEGTMSDLLGLKADVS